MFVILFFFFFKQKTAYEMSIGDWSSDVCSSDLLWLLGIAGERPVACELNHIRSEERRVGKEFNRRVDLGGRRIIKKKKTKKKKKLNKEKQNNTISINKPKI